MKNLVVVCGVAALLAGCGKSECDAGQVHQAILLNDLLVQADSVEGIKQFPNVNNQLVGVKHIKALDDRTICEARIETSGTINGLVNLLVNFTNKEVGQWVQEESWLSHVQRSLAISQSKELADALGSERFYGSTAITFSVKKDAQDTPQLIDHRYDSQTDFWGYQLASDLQPRIAAFEKIKQEEEEKERLAKLAIENAQAVALGYRDQAHRLQVDTAILEAEQRVLLQEQALVQAESTFNENAANQVQAEQQIAQLTPKLAALKKEQDTFIQELKTRTMAQKNTALEFSQLSIVKGVGSFGKPGVTLKGMVKNTSKNLVDTARLNAIVWSDRAGEVVLQNMFLYLGQQGLEPSKSRSFSIDLYDDFMPSSGQTNLLQFAQSSAFGARIWVNNYKDGMKNKVQVSAFEDPRVKYQTALTGLNQVKQTLNQTMQAKPQLERQLDDAKRLLEAAKSQLSVALGARL